MHFAIHAVGRMKAGPERELYQRYAGRVENAGRNIGITGLALRELSESRLPDARARCSKEAIWLMAGVRPGAVMIALDENGKDISSSALAKLVQKELDGGTPELAFIIGGPVGLDRIAIEKAALSLRFGSLTWPHQLVRIMLAEQLYRAVTILSGHPYHRN
jgi:23S rRNA (pseudouridine1915-N3)-methyltransferase